MTFVVSRRDVKIKGKCTTIENGLGKHDGSALSHYGLRRKQKTKDYSKVAENLLAGGNVVFSEAVINDGVTISKVIELSDSIENA
uniref:Uncharacterized protein n=1 Tax=Tanacetum cinerariifolium TaxID=118510 RepID=A0A6L2NLX4_TANCI|nr:hypothetical protein [Tanacetum cinerariifolium]